MTVSTRGAMERRFVRGIVVLLAMLVMASAGVAQTPLLVGQEPVDVSQLPMPERPQQMDGAFMQPEREGLLRDLRAEWVRERNMELPHFALDAGIYSGYVFRGLEANDDMVLQPAATIGWYGFTLQAWGNIDLDDDDTDSRNEFTWWDVSLDYTHRFGPVAATIGGIYYDFPNRGLPDTIEVFGGLALPECPLTPQIKAYYDIDEAEGWYFTFDLAHSIALPRLCDRMPWAIEIAAGVGYGTEDHNDYWYGESEDNFVDFHSSISLPVKVTHWFHVRPIVTYTSVLAGDLRDAAPDADVIIFGVNFTFLF